MSKIGNLFIANATLSQLSYGPDLRFDLRPQKEHLRMVGKDLAAMLPPGARLGIIDPKGNGLAALMVRYELTKDSTTGKAPSVLASYDFTDRDKSLKDFMAGMGASHAWVFQTSKKVRQALGVDLSRRASHLLEKKDGAWKLLES